MIFKITFLLLDDSHHPSTNRPIGGGGGGGRIPSVYDTISGDNSQPSTINRPIGGPDSVNIGGRVPGGYDIPGDNNRSQQRQPNVQDRPSTGGYSPNTGIPQGNRPIIGSPSDGRHPDSRYPVITGSGTSVSTHPRAPDSTTSDGRQPDGRYPVNAGSGNLVVPTHPGGPDSTTSDVYNAIRNAFKLPPGLCLVRCDTLRTEQQSLTPQQAHDAFISAGIIGPSISPGGHEASQTNAGRLPQNQLSQYPVGSQTHDVSGGGQLGSIQPGPGNEISNVGDQSFILSRPGAGQTGGAGDNGGYRYQTPQDRFSTGKCTDK